MTFMAYAAEVIEDTKTLKLNLGISFCKTVLETKGQYSAIFHSGLYAPFTRLPPLEMSPKSLPTIYMQSHMHYFACLAS